MLLPLSPQRIKGQNVSVISLHFAFHRQFGFYVLQIYVPLTLIVMCSWVTFWLRKTEKGRSPFGTHLFGGVDGLINVFLQVPTGVSYLPELMASGAPRNFQGNCYQNLSSPVAAPLCTG